MLQVNGIEVDIILEDEAGAVVALEVKTDATVTKKDFRGLAQLAEATGNRLKAGAVLYDGKDAEPFGDGLWALPISWLWSAT